MNDEKFPAFLPGPFYSSFSKNPKEGDIRYEFRFIEDGAGNYQGYKFQVIEQVYILTRFALSGVWLANIVTHYPRGFIERIAKIFKDNPDLEKLLFN